MSSPDITLGGWFSGRAARSPRRPALTFEGTTWTFGELLERIDRLAAALRASGVKHGDRVAFIGFNQPASLETWVACSRLGAIYVPLNFRLAGPELAFIIEDAGIHTVVAGSAQMAGIDAIREQVNVRHYIGVDEGAQRPEGWASYEKLITANGRLDSPDVVRPEELSVIMYTSGTTGTPKGVMLSHENLWWSDIALLSWIDISADDVTLAFSPLFHIAGLNFMIGITWMRGGHVVLHRSFDAQATLDDIQKYRIKTLFGVPAMFIAISQLPGFADADLSTVRMAVCGGAPAPEPLLRIFADRGIGVLQGYGLTETAPAAIFLVAEYALSKLGAAGQPPLYIEAKLMDGTREVTAPFERGEILLKGPNITTGYWNRPEATAAAFDPGGWFHTGDVGQYDDDGIISIVDRVKDMVISGGENVYPAEVENVLFGHPAVSEAAVIGLPDEKWGEAVTAVVALHPGATLTLAELREFANESLARYKLPQKLFVVDELPRNPTGKVLKFQLRDDLSTE
ncbi:MAG: long-chain fatty acid--CoA ligase [Tetrasphaera sp.]